MIKAAIPIALQVLIDDAGWWSGKDGRENGEPARTGIPRDHVPEDYLAIAMLGKKLAMRPQMAMCLCEWDRENILRKLPDSTWMGKAWDNRKWVGPWLEQAADIIRANAAHLEFAMHGIGHLHWNEQSRIAGVEWFDGDRKASRPAAEIRAHVDFYLRIMAQHDFGRAEPESFVAPCSLYGFGEGADGQTQVLKRNGIRYISTDFRNMKQNRPVEDEYFGIDQGLMIVDRKGNVVPWPAMDCHPDQPIGGKPLLGLHWPNILHPDYHRNEEVVDRWVDRLKTHDEALNTMLAADTRMCWTQLAYSRGTDVHAEGRTILLDFSGLSGRSAQFVADGFIVKIESDRDIRVVSADVQIVSVERDERRRHCRVTVRRSPGTASARLDVRELR